MDAATLFLVLVIDGKARQEHPRYFPNVAACEAYVDDLKQKLATMPVASSIASYECMRWYTASSVK